ncbi:MAG: hypothetical protein Q7S96_04275 [bacterium]|nr:hypothetical protein [bacterium]
MMRLLWILARAAFIALGAAGIGVVIGELWLADALDRAQHARTAAVQFLDDTGLPGPCANAGPVPDSMKAMGEHLRATGSASLHASVRTIVRCADDGARAAFMVMLRRAAVGGDATAQAALDGMTEDACRAIHVAAGVPESELDAATSICVHAVPRADGDANTPTGAAATIMRTFRFTQALTLVRAGTASVGIIAQFCEDSNVLPARAYDEIVRRDADLAALLQRSCTEQETVEDSP